MRVVALIPAAGRGRRMGAERPKAFLLLGGVPLLARTLRQFEACPAIDEIWPLVPEDEVDFCTEEIVRSLGLQKIPRVLAGGAERQDSVYLGLKAAGPGADTVIIHDGARPFIPVPLIERAIEETRRRRAVVLAIPAGDTIKEVSPEGEIRRTLDRKGLWLIQTPQCFAFDLIRRAHEKAREEGFQGTDDAALVERLGVPVKVITGSRLNFKITTPEDLLLGEALLKTAFADQLAAIG
jgi:2-C-methyl-D-erythritol 4-phosphate cytidylyltransferase